LSPDLFDSLLNVNVQKRIQNKSKYAEHLFGVHFFNDFAQQFVLLLSEGNELIDPGINQIKDDRQYGQINKYN
jgi:hypothetical protein